MFQYDASGFCGHVMLSGSHAGLSWDCSLCLAMLFVIHLFGRALRLIKQHIGRIQRGQLFPLPTSFANLVFATIGFGRQFPLGANISKNHLKKHKTNFSNISKTLTKLLKHVKDTKQTSQTSLIDVAHRHLKHSHEKLYLSLVSSPAARAVYQSDGCILVSVPATREVYRSFRPQCRAGSIWRCRFRRSCCVEWFSRWLVLRLLHLPCHAVCHTFVLARAALDRTFMRRIQRCQLFSFASVFCQSSFCNDWYWTFNLRHVLHDKTVFLKCCNASKAHWSHVLCAFTIITISIWMSVCEIQRNGTLNKTTIYIVIKKFSCIAYNRALIRRKSYYPYIFYWVAVTHVSAVLTHDVIMVWDDSSTFVGRLFVNRLQARVC